MSLSKTLYPLLSTGSTQEDLSPRDRKIADWDVKIQNNKLSHYAPHAEEGLGLSFGLSLHPYPHF